MVYGVGIDICENKRIEKILKNHKDNFLKRVFIAEEIKYCMEKSNPIPHLAARFAMKEAFIKAVGDGSIASYREIGLIGENGKKDPVVFGNMKNIVGKLNIQNIFCSISHADFYSTAVVVLEK